MKILLIHPNFPGQYKFIAHELARDPKNEVVFICNPKPLSIEGVRKVEVDINEQGSPQTHRYIQDFEKAVFRGQAVWRACSRLKEQGFVPDVIGAHPGWGDSLFVKDVFDKAPLLNYCEFYYRSFGADVHFDPGQPVNPDTVARVRVKNANNILNLEACDWGMTPTHWQHQLHPPEFKQKISVLHEGINTEILKPSLPQEPLTLSDGTQLNPGDEIVTYLSRNLEPYRGFPVFMRAVEMLMRERPNCHVLIVGNDGASYSSPPKDKTFKEAVLERSNYDKKRVHFLGYLPYEQMVQVLRYSKVHVYLTVPFVLSWSMLEAMALGCLILGSDTPPVREVIQDGTNGLLVNLFFPEKIVEKIVEVFDHPDGMQELRQAARQTIEKRYALKRTLPLHIKLIQELANKEFPPLTAKTIQQFYHFDNVSYKS